MLSLEWNERYRPIITPTRLYQGAMGRSIATLYNTFYALGKQPLYLQSAGAGYAAVRSASFELTQQVFQGRTTLRGLLLDDDIWVDDSVGLGEIITIADENGWNIVAPYMLADKSMSILTPPVGDSEYPHRMTVEEVADLEEYSKIWAAGLGFYYGDLPLEYKFHEGNPWAGEDLNFFCDNPQLETRVAPMRVLHAKTFLV